MPLPLIIHRVTKRFVAGVPGCYASMLALQRASLVVRVGEVVTVVGPPGCGKTTLLLCAAGLLRPDAGAVWWFERYHDVSSCSGLVRFIRHGPETPRMIDLAMERGARLVIIDGAAEPVDQVALSRSVSVITKAGGSALVSSRDRRTAAAIGARVVDLISGRTDISDEPLPRHQPARVAEKQSSVDPPMGWV